MGSPSEESGRQSRHTVLIAAASVCVIVVGLLSIGVFVGWETGYRQRGDGNMAYMHVCQYLHLSGLRLAVNPVVEFASPFQASKQSCSLFDIGHPLDLGAAGFYETQFEAAAHAR